MAENKGLSAEWLNDDEDVEEETETVYTGGGESPYMEGYSVQNVKITMAKRITIPKKKVEFIEIDFINKDGKTHREKFMMRGKDGKPFYTYQGKKKQHFGVSKIKSLIKVLGLYEDEKNLMAALYSNTEDSDVTYEEYGKEKTEEFTVFTDLIDAKLKICISSKKENTQMGSDDEDDQAYVKACIKATEAYKKANPKKKSLKKFSKDDDYINVYRWFTVSEVKHFCSTTGLFGSEMEDGEGELLQKFIDANDEGLIFEGRTLIAEDLTEKEQKKLGINEWGKQVDPDEDGDDDYEEPEEEEEEEDEEEEAPKKKTSKPKAEEEDDSDDDW